MNKSHGLKGADSIKAESKQGIELKEPVIPENFLFAPLLADQKIYPESDLVSLARKKPNRIPHKFAFLQQPSGRLRKRLRHAKKRILRNDSILIESGP